MIRSVSMLGLLTSQPVALPVRPVLDARLWSDWFASQLTRAPLGPLMLVRALGRLPVKIRPDQLRTDRPVGEAIFLVDY